EPERLEDAVPEHLIVRTALDLLDDSPQQVVAGVAVGPARAGIEFEREPRKHGDQRIDRILIAGKRHEIRKPGIARNSCGVRQQVVDRDSIALSGGVVRQDLGNGIIELELTRLYELEDEGGRELFRHGADLEFRRGRVRDLPGHVGKSEAPLEEHPVALGHERGAVEIPEIVIGLEIGRDLRRARNGRLSRYGLCRHQTNQGGCGDRYRMEAGLLAHGRLLFNEGATLISVEIVPDLTMEGSPYERER